MAQAITDAGGWVRSLRDEGLAWAERQTVGVPAVAGTARTLAYVDLLFAFGLARVRRPEDARECLGRAKAALGELDAHVWLCDAFEYRVTQCLDGKPHAGPLPTALHDRLDQLERLERYVADRLRTHSTVLEPDQRVNPYRGWGRLASDYEDALAEMESATDQKTFEAAFRRCLELAERDRSRAGARSRVVHAGLRRTGVAGRELTRELIHLAFDLFRRTLPKQPKPVTDDLWEPAQMLDSIAKRAATNGLADEFMRAVGEYQRCFEVANNSKALWTLEGLTATLVTGFFSLGLCEEADQFLNTTSQGLLRDHPIGGGPPHDGIDNQLLCLLALCAGWYAFGWDSLAAPVIRYARSLDALSPRENTQLLAATNAAVRLATPETAAEQFRWLFAHAQRVHDTHTTSSHFSISVLVVIESLILSAVEIATRGRA